MGKMMLLLLALASMSPAIGQDAARSEGIVRDLLMPLVPSGVVVVQIEVDGARAKVSGQTASNSQLSQFLRSIDSSPDLEAPELMEIAKDGSQYRYAISLTLPCLADSSCKSPAPAKQTVHKCTVDGVVTFQATPCPD